jgi:hypothetical protein
LVKKSSTKPKKQNDEFEPFKVDRETIKNSINTGTEISETIIGTTVVIEKKKITVVEESA